MLNNQKVVFKVGIDDYFIIGISGSNTFNVINLIGIIGMINQILMLMLMFFFSGIVLDVMLQIDQVDMIILYIYLLVFNVSEKIKQVDFGLVGNFCLLLVSVSINEIDIVVCIFDGQIVVIGGLMQMEVLCCGLGLLGVDSNLLIFMLFGNCVNNGCK